jgi:hypothetical protein
MPDDMAQGRRSGRRADMEQTVLQQTLKRRLSVLATRIGDLRQKMDHMTGAERLAQFGEIDVLEGRYEALDDRIRHLDPQATGAIAAETEVMADDLADLVDDFIMRIDAGYGIDPPRNSAKER